MASHAMAKSQRRKQLDVSLDVLTDGSEHTGHGTLFLTIWKQYQEQDPGNILVRYAISGLSSMTARLCSDQKLTTRQVRAVTCPTHSSGAGLASLMLTLSQAGAASLVVCGGPGVASLAETVASIILRNRAYPQVATCEVPFTQGEQQQWWMIYSDEYVTVHGASVGDCLSGAIFEEQDGSTIVLVYSILGSQGKKPLYSICVMPPGVRSAESLLRPWPVEMENVLLDFTICLNVPSEGVADLSSFCTFSKHVLYTQPRNNGDWDKGLLVRAAFQSEALHRAMPSWFPGTDEKFGAESIPESKTMPPIQQTNRVHRLESCVSLLLESSSGSFQVLDRRHLIRKKCQELSPPNNLCPSTTAHTFPVTTNGGAETSLNDENEIDLDGSNASGEHDMESDIVNNDADDENEIDLCSDEGATIQDASTRTKAAQHIEVKSSNFAPTREALETNAALSGTSTAQLLVLGTGCASPSPLRGSSGYALFLPSMTNAGTAAGEADCAVDYSRPELSLAAVIECGDGFLTALSRHLRPSSCNGPADSENASRSFSEKLLQIRLIWISHAHLDHYGGLPCLIRAIHKAGSRHHCACTDKRHYDGIKVESSYNRKKRKLGNGGLSTLCDCSCPPVVIAPSKVLQFLDASLRSANGKAPAYKAGSNDSMADRGRSEDQARLYFGLTHQEFESSPFAQEIRDYIFNYTLLCPRLDNLSKKRRGKFLPSELKMYRPFSMVRSVPVEHCPQAHALLLGLCLTEASEYCVPANNSPAGRIRDSLFLLCFSGDTRPSPTLVRACRDVSFRYGKNISLLLHESTFSSDERGTSEAKQKRHSTVAEALDIARQTMAEACVLTHFSQRYPRLPPDFNPGTDENGKITSHENSSEEMHARLNFAFASDGLLLPLSLTTLSSLPKLNELAISLLMQKT